MPTSIRIFVLLLCCLIFPGIRQSIHAQEFPGQITIPDPGIRVHTGASGDTSGLEALFAQGLSLAQTGHTDSALRYFFRALKISEAAGYLTGQERAHNNLAYCYNLINAPDSAILHLKHSIQLNWLLGHTGVFKKQYVTLAHSELNRGAWPTVKAIHMLAEQLYDHHNPEELQQLNMIRNLSANAYFQTAAFDTSANLYWRIIRSRDRQKPTGNQDAFYGAYIGLGSIAFHMKDHRKAIAFYEQALHTGVTTADTPMQANALSHMALIHVQDKDYPKAIRMADKALNLMSHLRQKKPNAYAMASEMKASALIGLGHPEEALPYALQSYEHSTTFAARTGAGYKLGLNYIHLKRYADAIHITQQTVKESLDAGMQYNLTNAWSLLSEAYAGQGNLREALRYKDRLITEMDSTKAAESLTRIAQIEQQYLAAEKEKKLAQQQLMLAEKDLKIRTQYWIIGGILALIGALAVIARLTLRNRRKLQHQQQEILSLQERMNGEQNERNRIARELHDGVTVLISAAGMQQTTLGKKIPEAAVQEEYQSVLSLLESTGRELRQIVHNLVPEQLLQKNLPAAIQSFCDMLEKSHPVRIEFSHSGNFTGLDEQLRHTLFRMVQELVQNVHKHARAHSILISMMHHEEIIYLTVEDDGKGFNPHNTHNGMGLSNLRARISQAGGSMQIRSTPGQGATVEIELPLPASGRQG